ncbi:PQQ-binding-like beta-propeller repeat protein [Promicromonospora sp. NPDC023805]|uniref:outer membrane protein assembly factor BamB family protein n=1 Tax=Promicromonospora sp. NPDC023805 TaxID=3154696 RepID=UPI00340A6B49
MARDPEQGGAYVFDLVDDGAADPAGPLVPQVAAAGDDPDGDDPEAEGAAPGEPPAGPGRSLRGAASVAAVLAIVLGTGLGMDGVRDAARTERMREVHGGVVDVSAPLTETWAWEGDVGPRRAVEEGLGVEVAVLGDVLAFESGGELVALSAATGAEAWAVPLGTDPDCGPTGSVGWGQVTTSALVCLAGPDADRAVTVVGPDGAVSAPRVLSAADTRRFGEPRPGPDGTVVRAERTGRAPTSGRGDGRCTELGECTGTVRAGQDLTVRAEDAVTGEERWRVTIPFRPTPADQCANWYGTSWDGSGTAVDLNDMLDPGGFGARISDRLVQLYGCGIEAVITSDGVMLGTEIEPGTGSVESLRNGGYTSYTFGEEVRTVLYDSAGTAVGEIDGYATEAGAVDGSEPDLLLGVGEPGARAAAYGADGTRRWDAGVTTDAQGFLAQVAGTAVILTGGGTVRGLDLASGEERWAWKDTAPGEHGAELYVARGFTDGQYVLLVVENGYGSAGLVSLDAVSGEVAWEQYGEEAVLDGAGQIGGSGLLAIDGNLLEVMPDGVRGLG